MLRPKVEMRDDLRVCSLQKQQQQRSRDGHVVIKLQEAPSVRFLCNDTHDNPRYCNINPSRLAGKSHGQPSTRKAARSTEAVLRECFFHYRGRMPGPEELQHICQARGAGLTEDVIRNWFLCEMRAANDGAAVSHTTCTKKLKLSAYMFGTL